MPTLISAHVAVVLAVGAASPPTSALAQATTPTATPTCADVGRFGLARFAEYQDLVTKCRTESSQKGGARARATFPSPPQASRSDADSAYFQRRARPRAIYVKDDRIDVEFLDRKVVHPKPDMIAKAARATTAIVAMRDLSRTGDDFRLKVTPFNYVEPSSLQPYPICPGEAFAQQKVGANCTGFLVAPNLLVTAGHCINWSEVDEEKPENGKWAVVFGFQTRFNIAVTDFRARQEVFFIRRIIDRKLEGSADNRLDYAIVELDGDVPTTTAEPLRLGDRLGMSVAPDTPLAVIGHPAGLPKKLSFDGRSRAMETGVGNIFRAQLNTFHGNSGSPVLFYKEPDVVAGILVAGEDDFKLDGKCARYALYSDGAQCQRSDGSWESCAEKVTKIRLVSQFVPEGRP